MCNRILRGCGIFIIIFLLSVLNITVVFADDVDVRASLSLVSSDEVSVALLASSQDNGENILSVGFIGTSNNSCLYFDGKNYNKLSGDDKRDYMEGVLKVISKSGASAKAKNKVYNFIASQDTAVTNAMKYLQSDANADFVSAKKYFDPWSSVIGTVLGVMCVMIFIFSSFSILFDMAYMVLPGVQAILERGDENSRPFGVSREAYTSLRDAEKNPEYKNVLGIYFGRRVGLIIAMSVCLSYVITGKIYDVIIFFMDSYK